MTSFAKKVSSILSLMTIGLLGVFAVLAVTSQRGIGFTGHGAEYVRMARNLLDGGSFSHDAVLNYWMHFPPLYPLTLALIHSVGGLDPVEGARWLNALLFGANIFLVGLIIYRQTSVIWLAVIGSLWMLVKVDIAQIHAVVFTEPLYLFWTLLWLLFFTDFLKSERVCSLWGFSIAAGMACVTRFAGIPLILTSLVMLAFRNKKSISVPLSTWMVFVSVSLAPMILWMLKNAFDGGRCFNRNFVVHPLMIPLGRYSWPVNPGGATVATVIFLGVAILLGRFIWKKRDRDAIGTVLAPREPFLYTVVIFIIIYLLAWFITICFFDAEAYCIRYFIPLEIFEMFFCCSCLGVLLAATNNTKILKALFLGSLAIYFIGMNITSAAGWYEKRYNNGEEYDGREWDGSEIIAEVKKIPSNTVIYTNNAEVLYVRANRQSVPLTLVSKVDMISLENNPLYPEMSRKMKADLKDKRGVVVYFFFKPQNDKLITMAALNKEIPLKTIYKSQEGGIYVWDGEKE